MLQRTAIIVRASVFLLLYVFTQPLYADVIQDFPHARTVFQSSQTVEDYRLTLGALKKANNQWLAEREQRVSGQLSRKTLELDQGFTAKEVFAFYRKQLVNAGARELFFCRSRDCGSSNSWANNRFEVKQLYGLDQYQWYGVFELARDNNGPIYVALYSVTRGNRRSYTQVDQVAVAQASSLAANPKTIIESIVAGQAYVIPGLRILADGVSINSEHMQSLVDALSLRPRVNVYIVGHDYGPENLAVQQATALSYAQAVKAQLIAEGVKAERLQVHGLGSLAPGVKWAGHNRVEVVLLTN